MMEFGLPYIVKLQGSVRSYMMEFGLPYLVKLQHIPNEFVIEHGPNLGDSVLLEVPNGVAWKVKLLNSSGMFSLFIFDLNASEIEYPPGQNEDMTPQNRSVLCVPPEESGINLPLLGEPPNENRINLTPPDDPPEEDVIYLSPPGIYTIMAKELHNVFYDLSYVPWNVFPWGTIPRSGGGGRVGKAPQGGGLGARRGEASGTLPRPG
uniref:Uncharacterized protein n=1 Tax=Solanum lycopersicum TaxID=4081 RepID=A0A3Q7IGP9_SOLLC